MTDLRDRARSLYEKKFNQHNDAELHHMVQINRGFAQRKSLEEIGKHVTARNRHGKAKDLAYKGMLQSEKPKASEWGESMESGRDTGHRV